MHLDMVCLVVLGMLLVAGILLVVGRHLVVGMVEDSAQVVGTVLEGMVLRRTHPDLVGIVLEEDNR